MIIKTQQIQFEKMATAIKEIHPYDVPEIIGTPILRANNSYYQWVKD